MKIDSPNIVSKLTVTGSAIITGSLTTTGDVLPAGSTQNLGSLAKPWKEIFVTTGSINFVDDGVAIKTLTSNNLITTESIASALPAGTVSGSSQISYSGITGVPAGIVSSSAQVSYTGLTNIPAGIVSSSAQVQLSGITGTTFASSNFTFPQDLTVQGKLTAQEFNTELISSSIIYESGSTKFGDTLDDIHSFTGSVEVLGAITGSLKATRLVLPVGEDLWA